MSSVGEGVKGIATVTCVSSCFLSLIYVIQRQVVSSESDLLLESLALATFKVPLVTL